MKPQFLLELKEGWGRDASPSQIVSADDIEMLFAATADPSLA
jgi:hypothetical protein